MDKFEYSEKNRQFMSLRNKLREYEGDSLVGASVRKLEESLREKDADGALKIAVCGQYSSGKSTLVHALTNDDTIAIGQDVTTDKVKCYEWSGMQIADTPGIYAGRQEHDALSLEYIKKADLLIYMITIQGFTREIGANFKSLVLSKYADKTMLVMNKRNQEPAENEPNWVRDTREFLGGDEMLRKFYFSIVDIEDYLIGTKENIPELVEQSNFDEFLGRLNAFVKDRELLGRLVSRINIADAFLSMYIDEYSHSPEMDDFTRRQKVAVQRAITAMNKAISDESIRMRQEVKAMKHRLVGLLADETMNEFKIAMDNVEPELEKLLAPSALEERFSEIVSSLEQEMRDVEHDALAYDARISALAQKFHGVDVGNAIDLGAFKSGLQGVSRALGAITKDGLVKFVHLFGGKFKPWGAVKCMKWISKAAPIISILGNVIDLVQLAKDQQHQRELEDARREILESFGEVENGIGSQLEEIKNAEGSLGYALNKLMDNICERERRQQQEREHKKQLLEKFTVLKNELNGIVAAE